MGPRRFAGGGSVPDLHALPEGDPAGDLLGGGLGVGIIPGGVAVLRAVRRNGEVVCSALPRADGRRAAVAKHRIVDRGAIPDSRGTAEWSEYVRAEIDKWSALVKKANIKAQ